MRASLAATGLPLNLGRSLTAAYPPTAEAASYAPAKEAIAAYKYAPVQEPVTGIRARHHSRLLRYLSIDVTPYLRALVLSKKLHCSAACVTSFRCIFCSVAS